MKNNQKIYQDLSKFQLPKNFRGKNPFIVQLWWLVQSIFISTSPQFMYSWRRFIFRAFGAKIGKNVILRPSAKCTYPWHIEIGDNSWIGYNTKIYNVGKVTIGNNVAIAHDVYICDSYHDITKTTFDIIFGEITICDESWIANDVFIGPNVTINKGCVIASRSSVFKNMREGYVCKGNPCEPYKAR